MKRILIIDDEDQIRRFLRLSLEGKGFKILEAESGNEGLQALQSLRPDLLLLDLGLPDRDGASVLTELRLWSDIPVIILTARDGEDDVVALLEAGADDYVTKPFAVPELQARIKAALRRTSPPDDRPFERNGLVVDFADRSVHVDGRTVRLTPTEYEILALLARAEGRVVTRAALLRKVWGPIGDEEEGALRVHVSSIRKKIERDKARPAFLTTVPGIGFRLCGGGD